MEYLKSSLGASERQCKEYVALIQVQNEKIIKLSQSYERAIVDHHKKEQNIELQKGIIKQQNTDITTLSNRLFQSQHKAQINSNISPHDFLLCGTAAGDVAAPGLVLIGNYFQPLQKNQLRAIFAVLGAHKSGKSSLVHAITQPELQNINYNAVYIDPLKPKLPPTDAEDRAHICLRCKYDQGTQSLLILYNHELELPAPERERLNQFFRSFAVRSSNVVLAVLSSLEQLSSLKLKDVERMMSPSQALVLVHNYRCVYTKQDQENVIAQVRAQVPACKLTRLTDSVYQSQGASKQPVKHFFLFNSRFQDGEQCNTGILSELKKQLVAKE